MKRILAVAVHPDDETLGCGGTLLRFREQGASVHWLILTAMHTRENGDFLTVKGDGQTAVWEDTGVVPAAFSREQVERRAVEIKSVSEAYAFASRHELGFPAMCLDQLPMGSMIEKISGVMHAVKPDTVILPCGFDVHSDHRVAFEAAYSCTKNFRYPFIRKILVMEIPSETDFSSGMGGRVFVPNLFVDIGGFMDEKLAIMSRYPSEVQPSPFPRSLDNIKALALNRGASAGFEYAESFMMLKERV